MKTANIFLLTEVLTTISFAVDIEKHINNLKNIIKQFRLKCLGLGPSIIFLRELLKIDIPKMIVSQRKT